MLGYRRVSQGPLNSQTPPPGAVEPMSRSEVCELLLPLDLPNARWPLSLSFSSDGSLATLPCLVPPLPLASLTSLRSGPDRDPGLWPLEATVSQFPSKKLVSQASVPCCDHGASSSTQETALCLGRVLGAISPDVHKGYLHDLGLYFKENI